MPVKVTQVGSFLELWNEMARINGHSTTCKHGRKHNGMFVYCSDCLK